MIIKSYEIEKNPTSYLKYNFFLLYGENYGLIKDIRTKVKFSLNKLDADLEILSLYENEIKENEENFYNSVYSGSLFGNRKLINVHNVTDKIIKQIEDILDKYPNNVFIIFSASTLEKKSKLRNFFETNKKTLCIPCYPDTEKNIEIIAINELKKNNIILSKECINLLVEKSNNDRNNLINEIEKIKSFALNKKNLEIDEIRSIINFSGEYQSDSFVNECLCGNILQYKKILSELYSNVVNHIFLLKILANKTQRLLKMKEMEDDYSNLESLLSSSKPPIFWKEKPMVKKQLTIWSLNALKSTIREINEIELLCKKNPQISKIIFLNFFTQICIRAKNYS